MQALWASGLYNCLFQPCRFSSSPAVNNTTSNTYSHEWSCLFLERNAVYYEIKRRSPCQQSLTIDHTFYFVLICVNTLTFWPSTFSPRVFLKPQIFQVLSGGRTQPGRPPEPYRPLRVWPLREGHGWHHPPARHVLTSAKRSGRVNRKWNRRLRCTRLGKISCSSSKRCSSFLAFQSILRTFRAMAAKRWQEDVQKQAVFISAPDTNIQSMQSLSVSLSVWQVSLWACKVS